MTRARTWLLRIAGAFVALAVALALLLGWLLYTPAGLRFALDRGVALMHGQFAYAGASGALAHSATVQGLRYRTEDGTSLTITRATVELKPWALLSRRLHVARARIDGIDLALVPAKAPAKSSGFSLQPPLTMVLDDVLLTKIRIRNDGQSVLDADSLALAGSWSSRRLRIRRLALRGADGSADLAGTLGLRRGYPGKTSAAFDWTQDGTRYAGKLTAQSDGKAAQLATTLTAPVAGKLAATLSLRPDHAWTIALSAPTFEARAVPALPAALKTLAIELHGAGNGTGGRLTGSITANGTSLVLDPAAFRYDPKARVLQLDPLHLRSPEISGNASITGRVELGADPIAAALDAKWEGVTLPADLVGQPLATHGDVHLAGTAERFTLKGATSIGPPGRLSDLTLDLAGTPRAIELHALDLVQKNGGVTARGTITLQPEVAWKLDASARNFDPGAILAGWNGALGFQLATQGTLGAGGPRVTLELRDARGTLRGRSIAGSTADLSVTRQNLLDGSLQLVAGGSRIRATGRSGARTDATLALDVASLGDWLPNASGSLQGQFTVRGAWPKLAVAGQLTGRGLNVSGQSLAALELKASIPNAAQPGGDLALDLRGVRAAGLDFDTVHLTGSGTEAAHRLQLSLRGPQLGATLAVTGRWQQASRRWTGTLRDVELAPQGMPPWRQEAPSAITWERGASTVAPLCLAAGTPRLCISGGRTARGVTTVSYELARLPLQLLVALAPGTSGMQVSGDIGGSGKLTLANSGAIDGTGTLAVGPGSIAYRVNPEPPLLAWTSLTANLEAHGANQSIQLHGALGGGGHIDGNVAIRGADHALGGNVDVDLKNLAALSALSPEVQNVQGSLAGALQLSGTLAAPRFQGRIETQGLAAELPRAGLKLTNGEVAISGDPDGRLAITGQVTSGKGVLHIAGTTGLAANAPLTLTLKGDDLLVADIPAARVIASPDLRIGRNDGAFDVTGTLAIPEAKVQVEKLPGGGPAKASPDVVIVDEPPKEQVAPLAMTAQIEVKLGDKVTVQGYGLDGTVHGQLAVRVRPAQAATGRGEIQIKGKYQAYGQDLTIERGRLLFAGTPLDNPGVDIRAVRAIRNQDVTVGLSVRGTAQRPILTLFSTPAMEQAEALSWLVTGRSLDTLKSGEGDTLNTAAQALGGLAGDRIAKSIGARLGLEAGVSSSEALGGSAFTAGKYLSPRLFVSYGVGLFDPGQVVTLRYTLNRFLQFEAESATTGDRASLNYRYEKGGPKPRAETPPPAGEAPDPH